jgi:hypothetical protein
VIARWKGIVEEINFGGSIMPLNIIENLDLKKPSFGPSKWPRKLKPAKNSKLPKLPENCFEPFGKGGWPPISTWIIRPIFYDGYQFHWHMINIRYNYIQSGKHNNLASKKVEKPVCIHSHLVNKTGECDKSHACS